MRDNEIFIMFRSLLLQMMPERGITDVLVKQNYQPTQQGRPNQSTVFMTKITDRRHGSRRIDESYDEDQQAIIRTETQVMESTFQFAALVSERNPADNTELTAADVLKTVAAILQSPDFIEAIKVQGAQVLRITDIRTTPTDNDRDRFEFEPSFDVVLTHKDIFTKQIPAVTKVTSGLHRV